jgi:hypothetical protein
MKSRRLTIAVFLILGIAVTARSAENETRYDQYTRQFGAPTDGVNVVSAGFFGSGGHEWLAAGGFAPDGTVILAGNVLGPEFQPASVLGQDGEKPAEAIRQQEFDGKGQQKLQKDGSPLWKTPSWHDPGVTGFLLRNSPDLKTVISAHRLPWDSGAITACVVAPDGAIYLAGKATAEITRMGGDIKELQASDNGMKSPACEHTFLAKLAPDASRVEWLRHLKGQSNAPKLELLNDGSLQFTAQDLRNFSPTGEELGRIVASGGLGHLAAINPKDATCARGGEHHSPTGREPWRCPTLDVYNPDGSQRHHLYDWLGPYVGLDNLRLVSDTAVRRVTFDPQGSLNVVLWSDGGNSVALREPYDIRTYAPNFQGLGYSAWGAGVLSAAYLVRLDPITYQVKAGTMWMSYLEGKNKPNSAWIDQLGFAPDGSVCLTGRAANSLIQTSNRLSPSQSGQHVAILREDLSSIRFSTIVPGSGKSRTGNGDETWGIASGIAGGKQRVLFLTGASEGKAEFKTPVVNASQPTFGGGWMDGYAILLEMDRIPSSEAKVKSLGNYTEWQAVATPPEETRPPVFADAKGRGPEAGQIFKFDKLKWVTVDAEFRDASEKLWPTFLYGHPKKGSFRFDPAKPDLTCVLECDRICQPNGDPSTRVIGEWIPDKDKTVDFSFEIKSLGPFRMRQERRSQGKGYQQRETLYATADAVLKTGGRNIPIKAECRFNWQFAKDAKQPNAVQIDAFFTTTGTALGLKNPQAAGEIKARVSALATSAAKPQR